MSSESLQFEIQRLLIEIFTNQLVSHGAQLFASLLATITFYGIIHQTMTKDNLVNRRRMVIVSLFVLTMLSMMTTYTLSRLYYYGRLVNVPVWEIPKNMTIFQEYYNATVSRVQKQLYNEFWTFVFVQPTSLFYRVLVHLFLGFGITLVLLAPLPDFIARIKEVKNAIASVFSSLKKLKS